LHEVAFFIVCEVNFSLYDVGNLVCKAYEVTIKKTCFQASRVHIWSTSDPATLPENQLQSSSLTRSYDYFSPKETRHLTLVLPILSRMRHKQVNQNSKLAFYFRVEV